MTEATTSPEPSTGQREPVLQVRDLSVDFYVDGQWYPAAVDVTYDVRPGEVLAIVGESGSGKTQSSMSLVGLLPPNGRVTGSAKLDGRELIGMSAGTMRRIRGKEVAVIFQEPMTALNPVYKIGFQIEETLRAHFNIGPHKARERALELLRLVEIPEPERRIDSYPHELSGGQRQRAMIAQALACDPRLLIADEPTTALDVTVQAEILKLMRDLRTRIDSGIILITHDMGVVADMADYIMVMKDGRVVERGTADDIFKRPQHAYTKRLLEAVPHLGSHAGQEESSTPPAAPTAEGQTPAKVYSGELQAPATPGEPLVLTARGIDIVYPGKRKNEGFKAVENADLDIAKGEVVGLVGESGSGKTTIGRAVVGLLPVASGTLEIDGVNMVGASRKDLQPLRSRVGIVFQDPGSSLNPRLPIGESIGEPLFLHRRLRGSALNTRVEALLDQVELPRHMRNRYPHELSGGQRQRVGIARALSLEPTLLVADEPTSALDVSVQAKVLELFQALQREHGFACLFISHDLAVVEMLSDRIAVMHHGKIVEVGTAKQVVENPRDDYTRQLLAAVPVPDPDEQRVRRETRDRLLSGLTD
ncbi:peptide/nickel transport system ATP-binding protein [Rarobacter faecitabidus]|uniref:Peptide/nickel transport system ATP-binding protein n=1 Tax=Rarobacter faecitabidus TaxID=13243 RepID=A0A542ZV21_RARFA|nr:ABC transporter ATP-binding protein [Rarobacter faecitabidus]TQL64030.1 peptide/nickel transport system ATP-binding protein [Rarobacter faecitabidus]